MLKGPGPRVWADIIPHTFSSKLFDQSYVADITWTSMNKVVPVPGDQGPEGVYSLRAEEHRYGDEEDR